MRSKNLGDSVVNARAKEKGPLARAPNSHIKLARLVIGVGDAIGNPKCQTTLARSRAVLFKQLV